MRLGKCGCSLTQSMVVVDGMNRDELEFWIWIDHLDDDLLSELTSVKEEPITHTNFPNSIQPSTSYEPLGVLPGASAFGSGQSSSRAASSHSDDSSYAADSEVLNLSISKTSPTSQKPHTITSDQSPGASISPSASSVQEGDDSSRERRRRQKLANKDNLYCQVCGDKSNGYNFGAITCESCKAFFRRNALKNKELKCNFDNSCKIDHFTRKFCTACRLNKCFDVNMKKEWILDEEALKKRKKLTRRSSQSRESDTSLSYFEPHTLHSFFGTPSQVYPPLGALGNLPVLPPVPTPLDSPSSESDYPPRSLDEQEQLTLNSMLSSYHQMENSIHLSTSTSLSASNIPTNLSQDYSSSASSSRARSHSPPEIKSEPVEVLTRFIKFVKTFEEYRNLCQVDQVLLLKAAALETLVIRSAVRQQPDKREEKPLLLVPGIGDVVDEIFNDHQHFIANLNHACNWDKTILVLIMIINLFASERPGVSNKESVAHAERRYSLLLQAYLRSRYRYYEAQSIYSNLMLKLHEIKSYAEKSGHKIQNVARVTDMNLETLMSQIFNIK